MAKRKTTLEAVEAALDAAIEETGETVGETQRPVHMGLIVGYVMPNSHVVRPAMVVAVREVRRVNLVVFVDGRNDGHSEFGPSLWCENVRLDDGSGLGGDTWHFLE